MRRHDARPLGIYAIKPPTAIALPGLPVIDFGDSANLFYLFAGFALLSYLLLVTDRYPYSGTALGSPEPEPAPESPSEPPPAETPAVA